MAANANARCVDDTFEDLVFLADHKVGATEAARRLGFASPTALEKWLQRHGGHQIYALLRTNDPLELGRHRAALHLVRSA